MQVGYADYHFAPTSISKENLIRENIADKDVLITGNTVIDALQASVEKVELLNDSEINNLKETSRSF